MGSSTDAGAADTSTDAVRGTSVMPRWVRTPRRHVAQFVICVAVVHTRIQVHGIVATKATKAPGAHPLMIGPNTNRCGHTSYHSIIGAQTKEHVLVTMTVSRDAGVQRALWSPLLGKTDYARTGDNTGVLYSQQRRICSCLENIRVLEACRCMCHVHPPTTLRPGLLLLWLTSAR